MEWDGDGKCIDGGWAMGKSVVMQSDEEVWWGDWECVWKLNMLCDGQMVGGACLLLVSKHCLPCWKVLNGEEQQSERDDGRLSQHNSGANRGQPMLLAVVLNPTIL